MAKCTLSLSVHTCTSVLSPPIYLQTPRKFLIISVHVCSLLRIHLWNVINIHDKCSKFGSYWTTIKSTSHKYHSMFLLLSWPPLEEYSSKLVYATLVTFTAQYERTPHGLTAPCCIHIQNLSLSK